MQMIEGPNLREAKELPTGVRDDVIHLQGNPFAGS
jgi:hypothetical protein